MSYSNTVLLFENLIFNLKQENIEFTVQSIMSLFDGNYPFSFCFLICRIIYSLYYSRGCDTNILLHFLSEIGKHINKNNINIFDIFTYLLTNIFSQTGGNYLLEKMIEENIISLKVIENKNSLYWIHYKSEKEIKEIINQKPSKDYFFAKNINPIWLYLIDNYSELSKNNWELHKKLIKEGHNPNEIAKIIRNDEIEKLQEISSQTKFDFNQIIEPSLYERCSYINEEDVTLIDYAAFFGSINCFKYLLMNGANTTSTVIFAVAGGNIEILHLCEHNHGFDKKICNVILCKTAIIFHRNDIFHYIYNKIKFQCITKFIKLSIIHSNYEIFSFFIKEGNKLNDKLMHNLVVNGNVNLIEELKEGNNFPKSILVSSVKSGNIELVKYFIKQKCFDINAKYIYCFYI